MTWSSRPSGAPAATAKPRACSAMCPRCRSPGRAILPRKNPLSPTAAMMAAVSTLSMRSEKRMRGLHSRSPRLANGNSIVPTNCCGRCATRSTARTAGAYACAPVFHTAPRNPGGDGDGIDAVHDSFVVGRGTVRIGGGNADDFLSATSRPDNEPESSSLKSMRVVARARRSSARFERMRRRAWPPVIFDAR